MNPTDCIRRTTVLELPYLRCLFRKDKNDVIAKLSIHNLISSRISNHNGVLTVKHC